MDVSYHSQLDFTQLPLTSLDLGSDTGVDEVHGVLQFALQNAKEK